MVISEKIAWVIFPQDKPRVSSLDADIGNKTERFLCVYPRKGYLHSGRNSIRFPLSQKEGREYSLNQM